MLLKDHLQALNPIIDAITQTTCLPSLSLGVLHNGSIVHHAHFGHLPSISTSSYLPPNEDTIYPIGSLTKSITSALLGILVEEGKVDWTTEVREVLPEFNRDDSAGNITIEDILSHRTGLAAYDGLWLISDNHVPLERSWAVDMMKSFPSVKPVRTEWTYNNIAYEVSGQVTEKVSGMKYSEFLRERVLKPLGMERTFYTDDIPDNIDNLAKPYACFVNGRTVELPMPMVGKDVFLGAAGGIRSSVRDLLKLYKAFMQASRCQFSKICKENTNPIKQPAHLWRPMIAMPTPSLREHIYSLGWVRVETPSFIDMFGPSGWGSGVPNPIIGKDVPSRLVIYHQGTLPGYWSFAAMIPEMEAAVVVLANSQGFTEGTKLVGGLLIDALLGNVEDLGEYHRIANVRAEEGKNAFDGVMEAVRKGRKVGAKPRWPLKDYVGRYWSERFKNYFIDVIYDSEDEGLKISFMGLENEIFSLEVHDEDTFFWSMTDEERVRRGRSSGWPPEYYIIRFTCPLESDHVDPGCRYLTWKVDSGVPEGDAFRKTHGGEKGTRDPKMKDSGEARVEKDEYSGFWRNMWTFAGELYPAWV